MAQIPQMGQQANRAVRSTAETILNKIPYGLIDQDLRVSEVIPTAKTGDIESFVRPQRMNIKKGGQFGQIEKHEKKVILKHVRSRPESPVPNGTLIYAAMHGSFHNTRLICQIVKKVFEI
jgi:hypothetical protein